MAWAQPSGVIHYAGRLVVGSAVFDGVGQFKFALVNEGAVRTYWRNAPDANSDGEPDDAVGVGVSRGLYEVNLGDPAVPRMAAIPLAVFTDNLVGISSAPLFLRVWFSDGKHGFERLSPDQRLTAVSFAMAAAHAEVAASVPAATITAAMLAPDALRASALTGTLAKEQIPGLDAAQISSGTLDPARLPANVALKSPDLESATAALNAQITALQSQVTALAALVAALPSGGGTGSPAAVMAAADPSDPGLLSLGYLPFARLGAPGVRAGTALNTPPPRSGHAAVWAPERRQMLVWGGQLGPAIYSASGGWYQPDTDAWQPVPPNDALVARRGHSLIWDGRAAFVWGGFSSAGYLNTGARFDSETQTWGTMALAGAPAARESHLAVRFAPFMVVFGGRNASGVRGDGALYDIAQDRWTALTLPDAPAPRSGAAGLMIGDRLLVWGGSGVGGPLNTGAQLLFRVSPEVAPVEWRPISTRNAPSPRTAFTAVLAGSRMIVWGGSDGVAPLGDGASYDPVSDTWQPIPADGAPSARAHHTAVWTGEEMLILGGDSVGGSTATGAAFNPTTGKWRSLSGPGNPLARERATTVWTGTEALTFGGETGGSFVASLERLDPQPAWVLFRKR